MLVIYRGNTFSEVCEMQLNRMLACEPSSVELVVSRDGNSVKTNKGNHYIIVKNTAKISECFHGNDSERDKKSVENDG